MSKRTEYSTQSAYDLVDAFKQNGCPVCTLGLHSVAHYIESTNYDSVGDVGVRHQLKGALGFCNLHAYQWLHAAFILGTAQIYHDVLGIILNDLQSTSWHPATLSDRVTSLLSHHDDEAPGGVIQPTASCPACAVLAETEEMLIRTLMQTLADPTFRDAYAASTGLCIPHLRAALTSAPTREAFEMLKNHAVHQEEILLAQLAEIVRKHDYRYLHEPIGEEKGAAARSVAHVAGAKGMMKPQII